MSMMGMAQNWVPEYRMLYSPTYGPVSTLLLHCPIFYILIDKHRETTFERSTAIRLQFHHRLLFAVKNVSWSVFLMVSRKSAFRELFVSVRTWKGWKCKTSDLAKKYDKRTATWICPIQLPSRPHLGTLRKSSAVPVLSMHLWIYIFWPSSFQGELSKGVNMFMSYTWKNIVNT